MLGLMLLGAVAFWLPDVLLQAVRAYKFNSLDVKIITLVMPMTFFGTFLVAKRGSGGAKPGRIGFPMLLGVWLFGGLFMMISASFTGSGFMNPDGARGVGFLLLLSLFPMYTFIMAAYDGSLFALLLVTIVAIVIWVFRLIRD